MLFDETISGIVLFEDNDSVEAGRIKVQEE